MATPSHALAPAVPAAKPERAAGPDPGALLAWYDRHRRDLPWRARLGETPDPYRVWLSEIMLQQTTVTAVRPYFAAFLARFPDIDTLAAAPAEAVMSAWAGLGYYSRARNLHACAQAVAGPRGGRFPDTEEGLRALPGIGPYTAAAVAAIAFGRPSAAVDGNVERVLSRLHLVETPLPASRPEIRRLALSLVPADRPGDFAQALMDLGATICTPRRPACALCPWRDPCRARALGVQDTLPRKVPKREGVERHGAAFVATRPDGSVLVRTRPPRGLLGGTAEVPTTAWLAGPDMDDATGDAPLAAAWKRVPGDVRHVFTHFPLRLVVYRAAVPAGEAAPDGMRWSAPADIDGEPFSNLMRKVLGHAAAEAPVRRSAGRSGRA